MDYLDIFSQVKRNMGSCRELCTAKLSVMADKLDFLTDLDEAIRSEQALYLPWSSRDEVDGILSSLTGMTITYENGAIDNFDFQTFPGSAFLYDKDGYVVLDYVQTYVDDEPFMRFGFQGFRRSGVADFGISDLYGLISDNWATSDIVINAIDLASAGQLNAQNFMSTISDYAGKMSTNAKSVVNTIKSALLSVDSSNSNLGLFSALQALWGNIQNASADDDLGKINFVNDEYVISTSIFLPIGSVIQLASGVLTAILSIVKPVIGAAVAIISNAATAIVNVINEHTGDNFKINSDGNDAPTYAQPFLQKVISVGAFNQYHGKLLNILLEQRALKLYTGMLVHYFWMRPNDNDHVYWECFVNANSAFSDAISEEQYDLFLQHICECAVYHQPSASETGPCTITLKTENDAAYDRVMSYINDNFPVCIYPIQDVISDESNGDHRFSLIGFRHVFAYAFILYLIMHSVHAAPIVYDVDLGEVPPVTDYYNLIAEEMAKSDPDYTLCIAYFYRALWLDTHSRSPLTQPDTEPFVRNSLRKQNVAKNGISRNAYAIFNNNFISAVRGYLNSVNNIDLLSILVPRYCHYYTEDDPAVLIEYNDIFENYVTGDSDSESYINAGYADKGLLSYSIHNKGNALVYPPSSSVSIWVQIAITSGVIALAAIAVAVTAVTIKKKIQHKAFLAQKRLSQLREQAIESGSYADFNAAYKATKKYNRFLGKLSGQTFDLNNSWIDYSDSASSSLSDGIGLAELKVLITGSNS